jgi:hypothetical protein
MAGTAGEEPVGVGESDQRALTVRDPRAPAPASGRCDWPSTVAITPARDFYTGTALPAEPGSGPHQHNSVYRIAFSPDGKLRPAPTATGPYSPGSYGSSKNPTQRYAPMSARQPSPPGQTTPRANHNLTPAPIRIPHLPREFPLVIRIRRCVRSPCRVTPERHHVSLCSK